MLKARKFSRETPEIRRETLVEATLRCLAREGQAGVSVRKIAAEAGVSIGLINHYFPGLDHLIAAAYEVTATGIVTRLAQAANDGQTPRQRIVTMIDALFTPANTTPELLGVWVAFWALIPHSPDMRKVQHETNLHYRRTLEGVLADLADAEKRVFDVSRAALGLSALMDGLWLEFCLNPDSFPLPDGAALCRAWLEGVIGPAGDQAVSGLKVSATPLMQ